MGLELLPPALARAWGILTASMRQRSWGGPLSLVRKLSAGCGVLGGWPAWPGSLAWHCFAKSSAWRCWVGVGTPPVSHFEPRPLHAHMGGLVALGKRSGLSVSMVRWCCMVRPGRSTPPVPQLALALGSLSCLGSAPHVRPIVTISPSIWSHILSLACLVPETFVGDATISARCTALHLVGVGVSLLFAPASVAALCRSTLA